MAQSTIGTVAYIIDPEASGGAEVLAVDCAISIDGLGAPREQIDITCLEDSARRFIGGLATPGQVTITINSEPGSPSHVRLHQMYVSNTRFDVAIGWGDGTSVPTIASDGVSFDLPDDRTFLEVTDNYVADFPFNFPLNGVVNSALSFQLSGFPTWWIKVTS